MFSYNEQNKIKYKKIYFTHNIYIQLILSNEINNITILLVIKLKLAW
jgi:hypothetical protein